MKIHCSGIGGIGLSAYAALQKHAGHTVSGSDRTESALLDDLRAQGIAIILDQSGTGVTKDLDLFVYTEALPPDHPERKRAEEFGIRQLSYPQALGELSREKNVIAVCGTHGKSSTTGMATRLLLEAGLDPTIVVGTKLRELNGRNWRQGKGDLFLLEACEYKRSFHNYHPQIILLTNCDGDHYDYYEDADDYRRAFIDFIRKLPKQGTLITHLQDPDCAAVATGADRPTVDADTELMIRLATPGEHMRKNAQLVLCLAKKLGIDSQTAEKAVSGYAGSWRRIELRGETEKGIPVIDDYGHHPKEVKATLAAVKEVNPGKRLVCVFQPHTHDRTLKLYREFTEAFTDAGLVIIPNIYDARKHADTKTVAVDDLVRDIAKGSATEALNGRSVAETAQRLPSLLNTDDVLVIMGAGDITSLAGMMVKDRDQ